MPINLPQLLNKETAITIQDIQIVRQKILQLYPEIKESDWCLLGTDGCHLCEKVENELIIIKKTYQIPPVQKIDIIQLPEPLLSQMATHIPVLITDKAIFNYPFGIMDIINFL